MTPYFASLLTFMVTFCIGVTGFDGLDSTNSTIMTVLVSLLCAGIAYALVARKKKRDAV